MKIFHLKVILILEQFFVLLKQFFVLSCLPIQTKEGQKRYQRNDHTPNQYRYDKYVMVGSCWTKTRTIRTIHQKTLWFIVCNIITLLKYQILKTYDSLEECTNEPWCSYMVLSIIFYECICKKFLIL